MYILYMPLTELRLSTGQTVSIRPKADALPCTAPAHPRLWLPASPYLLHPCSRVLAVLVHPCTSLRYAPNSTLKFTVTFPFDCFARSLSLCSSIQDSPSDPVMYILYMPLTELRLSTGQTVSIRPKADALPCTAPAHPRLWLPASPYLLHPCSRVLAVLVHPCTSLRYAPISLPKPHFNTN